MPAEDLEQAARDIPAESLDCIKQAADNIRAFHEAQKRSLMVPHPRRRHDPRPEDRSCGPRGPLCPRRAWRQHAAHLETCSATAIPAQAAGVREIAVVTPPRADGTLNPHILAAAHLLGVHEIYRMGGAWAIAALAYGTETVAPVDVIAGPGNIWVTTAKRLVQGRVGIDMIAGPSEVLVLADDSANPEWLAADMLSQAEPDALASAICITDNEALAHAVIAELERQSATLPRADIVRKSLADWSAVVLVPDMDAAIALANRVAPEHLGGADARAVVRAAPYPSCGRGLPRPLRAGALGDYFAGPTMCCPRSAQPVSPRPFPYRPSANAPASSPPARLRRRQYGRRVAGSPAWSSSKPMPARWNAREAIIPSTFNPRQRSKDVT